MTDWEKELREKFCADVCNNYEECGYYNRNCYLVNAHTDKCKSEIKKAVDELKRNEEMKYANWEWDDVLKDRGIE